MRDIQDEGQNQTIIKIPIPIILQVTSKVKLNVGQTSSKLVKLQIFGPATRVGFQPMVTFETLAFHKKTYLSHV